jgi:hypothetical protein
VFENGKIWHLEHGPKQQECDAAIKGDFKQHDLGLYTEESLTMWSDLEFQPWLFGYDSIGETNAAGFDMAIVEFLSDRFGLLYI